MKKIYTSPEFERIALNTSDVMTTSGGVTLGTWGGGDDDGISIGSGDFTFE